MTTLAGRWLVRKLLRCDRFQSGLPVAPPKRVTSTASTMNPLRDLSRVGRTLYGATSSDWSTDVHPELMQGTGDLKGSSLHLHFCIEPTTHSLLLFILYFCEKRATPSGSHSFLSLGLYVHHSRATHSSSLSL